MRKVLVSHWLRLLTGAVLVVTALGETFQVEIPLGSHHGVLIYGLVEVLKALPEVRDGLLHLLHEHRDGQEMGE